MRLRQPQPFSEIEHTADAGVEVSGATAEETLSRLVLAFASLLTGGAPVRPARDVSVRVDAGDRAAMAVDVLRELLYRFDVERIIPESVEVLRFDPAVGAELVVGVGPYDPDAHLEGTELKAVTLHEARFEPAHEGWSAQVVFDL